MPDWLYIVLALIAIWIAWRTVRFAFSLISLLLWSLSLDAQERRMNRERTPEGAAKLQREAATHARLRTRREIELVELDLLNQGKFSEAMKVRKEAGAKVTSID
jgi:hypothetical protein